MKHLRLIAVVTGYMLLCINCNRPNGETSQHRVIFEAGDMKVITVALDKKRKTMSVLFGNALAYDAAKNFPDKHSPGEIFTLVTWEEVDNPNWYGATINGKVQLVEAVETTEAANGGIQFDYEVSHGAPSSINMRGASDDERVQYILSMRSAVFPS